MYHLFENESASTNGLILIPTWPNIKNKLLERLLVLITHYRENPKYIKSNHVLVRLLDSIGVSIFTDDLEFVDRVTDVTGSLSMSLKLTSHYKSGNVFDGVFYGYGNSEILIATDEYFDLTDAKENWQELQPVKTLTHPKSDLNMDIPNGKVNSQEKGIAVITINIPMLAYQYKRFMLNELAKNPDAPGTVMQFVGQYPLANMLYSQTDVAIANRFIRKFKGLSLGESDLRPPIYVTDYTDKLDQHHEKLIKLMVKKHLTFNQMASTIPMLTNNSLFETMLLPDVIRTRQVNWALFIARIDYTNFLLEFNEFTGSNKNRQEINHLKRMVKQLGIDRAIKAALPETLYSLIELQIKHDIKAYLG